MSTLPELWSFLGGKPVHPYGTQFSTGQDLLLASWGFIFGGAAGGWLFEWSKHSFVIFFLIFGSSGALITYVLSNSSGTMQQDVAMNLAYLVDDFPLYLAMSVVVSLITMALLVLGVLLFEESIEEFIEPILFFLPAINQNLLVAHIIGRLSAAVFFATMLANLFISTLYAFPLAVILYKWFGLGSKPVGPDGRTDFDYVHIPVDAVRLLFSVFLAVLNNIIIAPLQGHPEEILAFFPVVLMNVGYGAGALILDISSGQFSASGDSNIKKFEALFSVTWKGLKGLVGHVF